MTDRISAYAEQILREIVAIDTTYILLAVLLIMAVIFLDSLSAHAKKTRAATGVSAESKTISVDGMKSISVKTYVSEMQGLAGRPDALISENGYIIPIERKPLARKLRDRYVAQLLVYMRLVEEFEGRKPPYGYLILGANCRRIKIENSPGKQAWLQKMIDEMHGVLGGAEPIATPHNKKCGKCDVRASCTKKLITPVSGGRSELLRKRA